MSGLLLPLPSQGTHALRAGLRGAGGLGRVRIEASLPYLNDSFWRGLDLTPNPSPERRGGPEGRCLASRLPLPFQGTHALRAGLRGAGGLGLQLTARQQRRRADAQAAHRGQVIVLGGEPA